MQHDTRTITLEVASCVMCPFSWTQVGNNKTTMEDGYEAISPPGLYCIHPSLRYAGVILEIDEDRHGSLKQQLIQNFGEPFPPSCPLARKEAPKKLAKTRRIDLT